MKSTTSIIKLFAIITWPIYLIVIILSIAFMIFNYPISAEIMIPMSITMAILTFFISIITYQYIYNHKTLKNK
jgi:hypothetical protein